MKIAVTLFILLFQVLPLYGEDMRVIFKKAQEDHRKAVRELEESRERIEKDRESLKRDITEMEQTTKQMALQLETMKKEISELSKQEAELTKTLANENMDLRALAGSVAIAAGELESIFRQSHFTAEQRERMDRIGLIRKEGRFPGIDDMQLISDSMLREIDLSGEVSLKKGSYISQSGSEEKGTILTVGKFTAAWKNGGHTGLLKYSESGKQFFALPPPPGDIVKTLKKYMEGKSEDVAIDLSGGAALRQITGKPAIIERIREGGPLVWPILAIGMAAVMIILERVIFLSLVHKNSTSMINRLSTLAMDKKWNECEKLLTDKKGRPLFNVLLSGIKARNEDKETIESILQEGILKELPGLERFIPTLNILGAIAPLMGLLGTVTGMIGTFRAITLYGTGDPRLMAGGISEALMTTMLGLSVAIPIMLMHSFLSGRVDSIADDLEEKSVALVNIILRSR